MKTAARVEFSRIAPRPLRRIARSSPAPGSPLLRGLGSPCMQTKAISLLRCLLLTTLLSCLFTPAVFAQNTTSSIRIEVSNPEGSPVGGATVTLTHLPTGRVQVLEANSQGVINARGLRVGGPYEIAIPDGGEYAADTISDIFLTLEETEVIPGHRTSGNVRRDHGHCRVDRTGARDRRRSRLCSRHDRSPAFGLT